MTESSIQCLQDCITLYRSRIPELVEIANQLHSLHFPVENDTQDTLIDLYEQSYPAIERALWSGEEDFDALLGHYQSLFREQETLIQQRGNDRRARFILSIPVADRPPHLKACLESILRVCKLYNYGGNSSGIWDKIRIIVAEDSREEKNIHRHLELVEEYRKKGLQVYHFGQEEQYELLQSIPEKQREHLGHILTTQPREKFYLKGQAANRNLSYLKCLQLTEDKQNTLYYMVDSDQSFCVNRLTEKGDVPVYALNYFHYIDRIFRSTDTLLLTGKIVGDPPVSPSVMSANFLDDVIAFFTRLAQLQAHEDCKFHTLPQETPGDAAYHDLAKLFGFENKITTYPYRCRLEATHDHVACLKDFAERLNTFFFGEHLTRKTYFSYDKGFTHLIPARTIYPGNYIVNYEGLKYSIPFGHLRLRMSGPTAGRLLAAEIKERFVSFNMPNLHRRTTEAGLTADFRPGVALQQENIDVSDEFERQFFGDLMLFSVEQLVKLTDVNQPFEKDLVLQVLETKEHEMLELYRQKHDAIEEKNRKLQELVFNDAHWWLHAPELNAALRQVRKFIDNIEHNFGQQSLAWRQIQSAEHRAQRKHQIIDALLHYREERNAWEQLFK